MGVVKISFKPRSKTYFSVAVHSVHSNTLRDAQKSCIRMISHHTSRVFCELRSRKTPRGMSPVNSNLFHTSNQLINIFHFLSLKECSHTIHNLLSSIWIDEICSSYRYCSAPAIMNSRASSALAIPPIPMIGIFTAFAT